MAAHSSHGRRWPVCCHGRLVFRAAEWRRGRAHLPRARRAARRALVLGRADRRALPAVEQRLRLLRDRPRGEGGRRGTGAEAARLIDYLLITCSDELPVLGLQSEPRPPPLIHAAKAFGDDALQTHPARGVEHDIAPGSDRLAKESGQIAGDGAIIACGKLGPDRRRAGDDEDRDQKGDQRIFDRDRLP